MKKLFQRFVVWVSLECIPSNSWFVDVSFLFVLRCCFQAVETLVFGCSKKSQNVVPLLPAAADMPCQKLKDNPVYDPSAIWCVYINKRIYRYLDVLKACQMDGPNGVSLSQPPKTGSWMVSTIVFPCLSAVQNTDVLHLARNVEPARLT